MSFELDDLRKEFDYSESGITAMNDFLFEGRFQAPMLIQQYIFEEKWDARIDQLDLTSEEVMEPIAIDLCGKYEDADLTRSTLAAALLKDSPRIVTRVLKAMRNWQHLAAFAVPLAITGNHAGIIATIQSLYCRPESYHFAWAEDGEEDREPVGKEWVSSLQIICDDTLAHLVALALVASFRPDKYDEDTSHQEEATMELCREKCEFTNNVLHLVRDKKNTVVIDSHDGFTLELPVVYEKQKELAAEELGKRGDPPYSWETYIDPENFADPKL